VTTDLSLEERVGRIEDRLAINDLVAAYCAAIDGRDLDAFIGCYTEDAILRYADGTMRIESRKALREYYTKRFGDYGVTFHYPHAHTVIFDSPDEAHGVVTAHAEMALSGEAWIAAFRYSDRYRRVEGRWLFAERELACWYYMPLAQLATGMAAKQRKHYRGEIIPAELPESLESYKAWHGMA
jgi:ketosteroid isomerase-like protein